MSDWDKPILKFLADMPRHESGWVAFDRDDGILAQLLLLSKQGLIEYKFRVTEQRMERLAND